MTAELLYEVADGVATITINRPERRNALSWDVIAQMRAPSRRGEGRRGGSRRGDHRRRRQGVLRRSRPRQHGRRREFLELHEGRGGLAELFKEMWALGKPTIARVHGYALAGGFGLALACDMVIAADNAIFGTPEIDVGLWPYMITVPLTRSMPPKKALELMMTGRRVDAAEADRIGFVTRVVPVDRARRGRGRTRRGAGRRSRRRS